MFSTSNFYLPSPFFRTAVLFFRFCCVQGQCRCHGGGAWLCARLCRFCAMCVRRRIADHTLSFKVTRSRVGWVRRFFARLRQESAAGAGKPALRGGGRRPGLHIPQLGMGRGYAIRMGCCIPLGMPMVAIKQLS